LTDLAALMSGIVTTFTSLLPAKTAAGALIGPGLIWVTHRTIRLVELWLMLRLLPRNDRATAAAAYLTTHPARTHAPSTATCRRCAAARACKR
jgi:hypothetical protein